MQPYPLHHGIVILGLLDGLALLLGKVRPVLGFVSFSRGILDCPRLGPFVFGKAAANAAVQMAIVGFHISLRCRLVLCKQTPMDTL